MFRYLVTDTPGQVAATTPKAVLSDDTKVPIRVEVRDKEYKPVTNANVQARFIAPDGTSATMQLSPQPLEEGIYTGDWTAEKPGSYVAEIIAGREQEELGRDVLSFRREDGVAENFHTSQNRELLRETFRSDRRPLLQAGRRVQVSERHHVFGSGHHRSRNARPLGYADRISAGAGNPASEWLLRRKWGVV